MLRPSSCHAPLLGCDAVLCLAALDLSLLSDADCDCPLRTGALTVLNCVSHAVTASHAAESLRAGGGGAEGTRESWEASVGDVAFWNEEALILSRRNGVVTIMPIREGPERAAEVGRFHFGPGVTSGVSEQEGGSLVLECRRRQVEGVRGEAAGEALTAGR
eukprot:17492-Rhodomonas_salina.4